jgi:hypothetical protein
MDPVRASLDIILREIETDVLPQVIKAVPDGIGLKYDCVRLPSCWCFFSSSC